MRHCSPYTSVLCSFLSRTSADKNECDDYNGGCEDVCVNDDPGFHCECEEGELGVDKKSCTGNSLTPAHTCSYSC